LANVQEQMRAGSVRWSESSF